MVLQQITKTLMLIPELCLLSLPWFVLKRQSEQSVNKSFLLFSHTFKIMGGLEPTLYLGSMWYTPILQEWYYQVEVLKLEVGGENLNLDCREVSHFIYFSPYMLGFFSFSSWGCSCSWTNPAIRFEGIREKPDYVTFFLEILLKGLARIVFSKATETDPLHWISC